ncbi:sensor histidine kinase [Halobacteriales archaeon QS_9_67_15]|nr:MAG: sensor histidine kinase [Halobacteriales archaeon QS_9_67_15]
MRLRARFAVALAVVALVLSATTLTGFFLYRDAVVTQEREELSRSSESVATQLDTVLAEKQRQVRLWVEAPSLTDYGSISQVERLSSFVRTTDFSGASVIAANGTMMALYSDGLSVDEQDRIVGGQFGDRAYFQRAMAGDTYVSDPVQAETDNFIVTVSTPLYEDDEVVATFNAAFHIDEGDLSSIIRANSGPSQRVRIVANDSTVYSVGSVPDGQTDVITADKTVAGTGWVVSTTTTRAAFESDFLMMTVTQAVAFGLVLLSLAVFGAWLYREFIRNLERLHRGFGSLVAGEYGSTVALRGATEWTELEGQFNELSETLAQRRTEVVVLNRVLRHNLRNAMTVVVGSADRIVERTDEEETATEADGIRRRGESLLDLADHARAIETSLGARAEETVSRSLDAVVEEVVTTLAEEFPQADIRTERTGEPAELPNGDVLLVVLDELARNAVTHNDAAEPAVRIDATVADGRATFTVADDGQGMPAVERRVLTEQFVETPTQHGAGLGLWLVNWLVRWMDGEVSVAVDDGTTVTVTVPCDSDPALADS